MIYNSNIYTSVRHAVSVLKGKLTKVNTRPLRNAVPGPHGFRKMGSQLCQLLHFWHPTQCLHNLDISWNLYLEILQSLTLKSTFVFIQNKLVIEMPRVRKQTARYGNQDQILDMSELDTSDSDADEDLSGVPSGRGGRGKSRGGRGRGGTSGKRGRRSKYDDDFTGLEDESSSQYSRAECFKVEKNLLVYG